MTTHALDRLKATLLTNAQRMVLLAEPLWDFDPPQRESYPTDIHYVLALKAYAIRVLGARS